MEELKNVAPVEDFNWDAYENGDTSLLPFAKILKRLMTVL